VRSTILGPRIINKRCEQQRSPCWKRHWRKPFVDITDRPGLPVFIRLASAIDLFERQGHFDEFSLSERFGHF
jgi:hypothetical protein